jgi:hypothetical protein
MYFVLLFIQNIVIFSGHYFNKVGFPWDFSTSPYAWPAFWTTSIQMGIFPQWIPYEAMGYPLAINAQNGLYYPPYWIFALLHIPFTLDTAVILQVLTVLFGSFGMFLLLNLIFKSSRYALIGAVAFQFFGGFYSNAEHAEIVRAFAIAPWVFYVFKLNLDKPNITRRSLFIPIVIYFLTTGGYSGNFISTLFIIPVFLCLEIFHAYLKVKRRALKVGVAMVGLMILGISLSIVYLGPILQERNQLTRFVYPTTQFNGLSGGEIPAFFMSSRPIAGEPSMTSTFVTLPLLVFASFIQISTIKKHWTFIAVLILSILMVGGPNSPFWQIITSAVPTLKLSRFPSSDYRVFVAIPLIILGTAGLKAIVERKLSWKEVILRGVFVVTWFSLGIYSFYSNFGFSDTFQIALAVFLLSGTILIVIYYVRKNQLSANLSPVNKPFLLTGLGLLLIVILISSDGVRVVYDMQTWRLRPFDAKYVLFNVPLEKNGKLITYSIFESIPNERPPRENCCVPADTQGQNFSWKGYLQGTYMMQDYVHTILIARSIAESNNVYRQYMLMKWSPLLLPLDFANSSQHTRITIPISTFSDVTKLQQNQSELCSRFTCDSAFSSKNLIRPAIESFSTDQVVQTRYGINDISYKVTLKEPRLMVENEIYFPGWQADLILPDKKETKIQASVVNDVFRAWLLPAGDYQMIAHFYYPNLIAYQSISIISLGIWIFIMVRYWRRLVDYEQPTKKEESVTPS